MKPHSLLKTYVGILAKSSEINSLVIRGNGGIGKTYTIVKALADLGLKRNKHYILVTGHLTPLQLYNLIVRSATLESPRILLFDDVDSIIQSKTSIALLKGALWEADGRRIVSYNSSTSKLEGPTSIEFKGKVIMVLNNVKQESAFGKPLLDRGIMFDMLMQPNEVIEYIEEIMPKIKTPLRLDDRRAVWAEVKRFADNPAFSVRSLIRAMEFYHLDKMNWLTQYVYTLNLTHEQKILYSVREEFHTPKEQEAAWIGRTGKSRATYHRTKKQLTP